MSVINSWVASMTTYFIMKYLASVKLHLNRVYLLLAEAYIYNVCRYEGFPEQHIKYITLVVTQITRTLAGNARLPVNEEELPEDIEALLQQGSVITNLTKSEATANDAF